MMLIALGIDQCSESRPRHRYLLLKLASFSGSRYKLVLYKAILVYRGRAMTDYVYVGKDTNGVI